MGCMHSAKYECIRIRVKGASGASSIPEAADFFALFGVFLRRGRG